MGNCNAARTLCHSCLPKTCFQCPSALSELPSYRPFFPSLPKALVSGTEQQPVVMSSCLWYFE